MELVKMFDWKGKAQTFPCELYWNGEHKEGFYCGYVRIKTNFRRIFRDADSPYKSWKHYPPEEVTYCEYVPDGISIGFDTGHYGDFYGNQRTKETDEEARKRLEAFAKWVDDEIVARNYGFEIFVLDGLN